LPKLPKTTTSEIVDKSKSDMFIKGITAFQVLWFILQVIVRAVRSLSISQLEVAVTAFGVCAIITYFLVLPKPKGVDVPIILKQFEDYIPVENPKFHVVRNRVYQSYVRGLFVPGAGLVELAEVKGSHIPNDTVSGFAIVCLDMGVAIGGVIFGAIHIAAWNLSFPTAIEQTLWRTASIISTALLLIMYLPLLVNEYIIRVPVMLIKVWDIIFGGLYVIARAFLLVEIFRTLFYLPEDAYVTTWGVNVPHLHRFTSANRFPWGGRDNVLNEISHQAR
jgi:hypothetical protein